VAGAGKTGLRSSWPVEERGRGGEGRAALDLAGGGCGRGGDGRSTHDLVGEGCGMGGDGLAGGARSGRAGVARSGRGGDGS
jgi:hypothetical protein